MSLKKWIPWQLLASKAAKAYGFANPIETLDRIRKFSKPSESNEPIELLRAGFAFHARGLANTKAIQNNLDWVWPYWIQRQYNPRDISFIPRAFSFSHVNLTQRNWTAVGVPDSDKYAIVDPRGLVTPFHDSWSLAFWIVQDGSREVFPDEFEEIEQRVELENEGAIRTVARSKTRLLSSLVSMRREPNGSQTLQIELEAKAEKASHLAISVRPYNPEGIQFIDTIDYDSSNRMLTVNGDKRIQLPPEVERVAMGSYERGDILHDLFDQEHASEISCEAGMGTASALVPLSPGKVYRGTASYSVSPPPAARNGKVATTWKQRLAGSVEVSLPDERVQRQYELSKHALALLSPDDIYPGPYTYRRFWFRDACLIAHSLLRTGQIDICRRALQHFPKRQSKSGYFLSQEGEWDSNGQVLWIYDQFEQLSGERLPDACAATIESAIRWIERKRVKAPGEPHDGLLPAGFSAEHFGPNDYYYWDDFWAIGGLRAASSLLMRRNKGEAAQKARDLAGSLEASLEQSLSNLTSKRAKGALPASAYRRMDSGAIGSMVVDYPLQLWPAADPRVMKTADFLYDNCVLDGAFFQDMIHSGLNIYLTLDLAQTFLRAGDQRWKPLFDRCLELATPTGQWPEAVHPLTLGGCMGDGQHAWAAAEWVNLTLSLLVREEEDELILGSGITEEWIQSEQPIAVRRLPTRFGRVTAIFEKGAEETVVAETRIDEPRGDTPAIHYRLPGFEAARGKPGARIELVPSQQTLARK